MIKLIILLVTKILKKEYPLNFNVIVTDYEGCLCEFMKDVYVNLLKIWVMIFLK